MSTLHMYKEIRSANADQLLKIAARVHNNELFSSPSCKDIADDSKVEKLRQKLYTLHGMNKHATKLQSVTRGRTVRKTLPKKSPSKSAKQNFTHLPQNTWLQIYNQVNKSGNIKNYTQIQGVSKHLKSIGNVRREQDMKELKVSLHTVALLYYGFEFINALLESLFGKLIVHKSKRWGYKTGLLKPTKIDTDAMKAYLSDNSKQFKETYDTLLELVAKHNMWNKQILPYLPTQYKVSKKLKSVPIMVELMKKNSKFVKMAESGYLPNTISKIRTYPDIIAKNANEINLKFIATCLCTVPGKDGYKWRMHCNSRTLGNEEKYGKCEIRKTGTFNVLRIPERYSGWGMQIPHDHDYELFQICDWFKLRWGDVRYQG